MDDAWHYWYKRYLKSKQWKDKAKRVRKRDRYRCRACGRKGFVVHHMTYKRVGKERLSDLITVCDRCHDKLHGK